jgi:DnaD/phage-associated family protein
VIVARPIKEGLDYFPLDVDIDQDDKIALIEAAHGITGFGVVIKLLMKIYKEGYYYNWTDKEKLLLVKRVNVDINTVDEIIKDCLKWGLFDKNLFEKHEILTSKGIQKRYLEAVTRRKEVSFLEKYILIDPAENLNNGAKIKVFIVNDDRKKVNVNINSDNDDISTQRKGKQSKTDKSKEKQTAQNKNKGVVVASENIFSFYENNFGTINPFMSETLGYWADDMGEELLLEAMKISLQQQKKFKYAEGVLKRWKNEGVKSVDDIPKNQNKTSGTDWDNA